MIKKKAYEKQNLKTLYDNQAERVKKQSDFSNYGFDEEYGYRGRRLNAKTQATNIFDFKTIDNFTHEVNGNNINITLSKGNYLIFCVWQTTSNNDSMGVYTDNSLEFKFSGGSATFLYGVEEDGTVLSLKPITNTGTWTYTPLFISL